VGSYVLSSLVSEYDPFAKCTVHIVKQQEVVTYLSPVEVFGTGNWQKLYLIG